MPGFDYGHFADVPIRLPVDAGTGGPSFALIAAEHLRRGVVPAHTEKGLARPGNQMAGSWPS